MMKKGQVFIRALNKEGKWGNVDMLDLDETSFRAAILDRLVQAGVFVALSDDVVEGDEILLMEKREVE